jgi:uncharacterized damage-inducible protein DinB
MNTAEILKSIFNTSYNKTEWFVAFNQAVKGLTQQQATQKISSGTQSIFEIVAHLTYWNERYLKKMRGEQQSSPMLTDNELTFTQSGITDWNQLLQKAETVFEAWGKHLEGLSEKDTEHYTAIANTSMHNAYHIGQIVTLRKLQSNWNVSEGVK